MVKYRTILSAIAVIIISGCEPGASRGFLLDASRTKSIDLFDQEVNRYLIDLGFSKVEIEDPLYPQRTLYKKYPVQRDQRNVQISVQLTYAGDLKPEVVVGEWVANSLSSESERILKDIKDMADKHGLVIGVSR